VSILFQRAIQWCQVNKALCLDLQDPKRDPHMWTTKYSAHHQRTMKECRAGKLSLNETTEHGSAHNVTEELQEQEKEMGKYFETTINAVLGKSKFLFLG